MNKRLLSQISKGDTLKCLNCGRNILLNDDTFTMGFEAEYISCPYCKAKYDVQVYHLYGEKVTNEKSGN